MRRRKSQAKRREVGPKGPDEVSSGEQVGVVGVAVGCKIRMAGRPFGRMTDSTDGRVPVPSHKLGSRPRIWLAVSQGKRWLVPDGASIR